MIGLDTYLFTRNGLVKLKDLNLYDEVLTPLGTFEPIIKMSKIESIENYIKISTDEIIACSDELQLPVYEPTHKEKMIEVSCIKDKKYYTTKILPYDSVIFSKKDDLYNKGTKIPKKIDNETFILSSLDRYELLCGMMDTPMCSLKSKDGIYEFRPHSYEFEKDLVTFFRLFGFPVSCTNVKTHRTVKFGIQNISVIDDIPIRDRYKDIEIQPPDNRYTFMPIKDNGKLKNNVEGRSISVKGGLALIGYSLIPVKCQIL